MIDAHVHVWRIGENGCTWPTPELAAIHRHVELSEYQAMSTCEGVRAVLLVQTQEDSADTRWLLSLAEAQPMVAGVVGWTDLKARCAASEIRRLAGDRRLRGLRPMVQELAADWFDDPALDEAFAAMAECGLVLDALVRPRHLPALERAAARHPALPIVINHAAKPDFADLGDWSTAMRKLALWPSVACKVSGLLTELEPGHPTGVVDDVFDFLQETFGRSRLIWGSDWPVLTLAGDYAGWIAEARRLVPAEDHSAVFGDNARRIYRLAA